MTTLAVLGIGSLTALAAGPDQDISTYEHVASWDVDVLQTEPLDLALGPDSALYVANGGSLRVERYDADGRLLEGRAAPIEVGQGAIPLAVDVTADRTYVVWAKVQQVVTDPGGVWLEARAIGGDASLWTVKVSEHFALFGLAVDAVTGDAIVVGPPYTFANDQLSATILRVTPDGQAIPLTVPLLGMSKPRPAVHGGRLGFPLQSGGMAWYALDGELREQWIVEGWESVPVEDLSIDSDGSVWLLMEHSETADPPVLAQFSPDGELRLRLTESEVAVNPPPLIEWPWAIDVAGGEVALSTGIRIGSSSANSAGAKLQTVWLDQDQTRRVTLDGPVVSGYVLPEERQPVVRPLAIAARRDGGLAVGAEGDLSVRFYGPNGELDDEVRLGAPLVDFSLVEGDLAVTSDDGWLSRLPAADPAKPKWRVDCACDLGGRVGAGPAAVYVSQPWDGSVGAFDADTGASVGRIHLNGAVGLWPADVEVASDGRVYTADLVAAQVQGWRSVVAPEVTWQAGLLVGPRRLGAGRLTDGTEVLGAYMADGAVELHSASDGNLLSRWVPALSDGSTIALSDLALGGDRTVYVADPVRSQVHVFEPGAGATPTPVVNPSATPPLSDKSCRVEGDKIAAPSRIVLGESAAVTLTLAADCPGRTQVTGADIVLVIDRSGSMSGPSLDAAKAAARSFVEFLDIRHHRIALVSFSTDAVVDEPLTDRSVVIVNRILSLQPGGGTDMASGVRLAAELLDDSGRADALPVIVLLSDGRQTGLGLPVAEANYAKNRGIQIYTIGLGSGADQSTLRDMASTPERFYYAPSPAELFPIYSEILRVVVSSLAGNLVIDDVMGDDIRYVTGSARPAGLESPGRLRWGRSLLPSSGITLTYDILPQRAGRLPTNREAIAQYTDGDGVQRQYVFPVPEIEVITPTPSPTLTPTATPTPTRTPVPGTLFLPVAYRLACLSLDVHADIVLLVDTSSSMAEGKLEQARTAASAFVSQLVLPLDQAAVFGFHQTVDRKVGLTGDWEALETAIAGLEAQQGTRIDAALEAAWTELTSGPTRRADNRGVVVLLSDGAHNGTADEVLEPARRLKDNGIQVFAIGLGEGADRGLLVELASPGGYYFSPDENGLEEIYRTIAVTIPCR